MYLLEQSFPYTIAFITTIVKGTVFDHYIEHYEHKDQVGKIQTFDLRYVYKQLFVSGGMTTSINQLLIKRCA